MGAAALLRVGHLAREHRFQPLGRHARPLEHALTLHLGRGADDDHRMDLGLGRGLEEERNVEEDDAPAGGPRRRQESLLLALDQRVDDRFELRHRRLVAEDASAEPVAVDRPVHGGAGKGRLDQRSRRAAIEGVDGAVGIEDGDAARCEHRRRPSTSPSPPSR